MAQEIADGADGPDESGRAPFCNAFNGTRGVTSYI